MKNSPLLHNTWKHLRRVYRKYMKQITFLMINIVRLSCHDKNVASASLEGCWKKCYMVTIQCSDPCQGKWVSKQMKWQKHWSIHQEALNRCFWEVKMHRIFKKLFVVVISFTAAAGFNWSAQLEHTSEPCSLAQ